MTEPAPPPAGLKRIVGLILITMGILWMAASGLCSAGFVVALLTESGGDLGEALSTAPMIVIVGGFSIGVGFVLYVVGRALRPKE
jgi:hypothetical protein